MILGIDPGKQGGIAFLNGEGATVYPMPDLNEFIEMVKHHKPKHAFVEKQQAFRGQGVVSMFTLGKHYGELLGILAALQVPVVIVTAKTWKQFFGIAKAKTRRERKQKALAKAKQLFPHLAAHIGKKDGLAEALLIAEWGRRAYLGGER